jgi:hypothetical protein
MNKDNNVTFFENLFDELANKFKDDETQEGDPVTATDLTPAPTPEWQSYNVFDYHFKKMPDYLKRWIKKNCKKLDKPFFIKFKTVNDICSVKHGKDNYRFCIKCLNDPFYAFCITCFNREAPTPTPEWQSCNIFDFNSHEMPDYLKRWIKKNPHGFNKSHIIKSTVIEDVCYVELVNSHIKFCIKCLNEVFYKKFGKCPECCEHHHGLLNGNCTDCNKDFTPTANQKAALAGPCLTLPRAANKYVTNAAGNDSCFPTADEKAALNLPEAVRVWAGNNNIPLSDIITREYRSDAKVHSLHYELEGSVCRAHVCASCSGDIFRFNDGIMGACQGCCKHGGINNGGICQDCKKAIMPGVLANWIKENPLDKWAKDNGVKICDASVEFILSDGVYKITYSGNLTKELFHVCEKCGNDHFHIYEGEYGECSKCCSHDKLILTAYEDFMCDKCYKDFLLSGFYNRTFKEVKE